MTSDELIKETAKAIATIYGEPSRWANYQIDARAAIKVIAPAVLERAAERATSIYCESDFCKRDEAANTIAIAIRNLKKEYSHDQ